MTDLAQVVSTIRRHTAALEIRVAEPQGGGASASSGAAGLSWGALLAGTLAGTDPTREWRELLDASTERQYGSSPRGMSAAFVLQWMCETLAVPLALSARCCAAVPEIDVDTFFLDVDGDFAYPRGVLIGPVPVTTLANAAQRLDHARRLYEGPALAFADAYDPGVKMSSRQRHGMVRDMWERACAYGPVERHSCCLIYAIPGLHECAGCPRGRAVGGHS